MTNGGTISGKVTYEGPPPPAKAIPVTQDPTVCGATREVDSIKLGAGKGLEGVIVYLKNVPSGKKMTAPLKPVLDQKGCHYLPHVQVIAAGAELEVKNSDPLLHNVHAYQDQGGPTVLNLAMPKQGMVIPKKIKKAGGMTLKCDVHSFMRGVIFAADNPYYAVTDKDGAYEITDVPPGTYEITTFHEVAAPKSGSVTVASGGKVTFSPKVK